MKRLAVLLGLLLLIGATDAWGLSGHLGEFGVGDSIDVPYHVLNCSGSKRAVSADSVTYSIYKDTLGHYAMPVDSGKVTATTAPSFAVSAGRGFVNYFLRVCANAGNHAPGRYTAWIEAWDDTCSQMHNVWWDCYADSTTYEYAKNNRLIAGAIKAKTDNLPSDPADQSLIMDEVGNLDGASMLLPTATAHAAYETLFVHKEDFHSSGDTNSNPFQAGTDNVFLSGNYAQVANDNYDSMFFHKTDFHSEGDTNTNPFQAGTDDVFLSINYQTNADSFWLADTSQYSADDDSTMAGIAWRNKNLYDSQDWNPWDAGTRTLTVADWSTHSPADVWAEDTGGVALTKYGGAVLDYDNYKGTGADLSDEVDSLLAVLYDRTNDSNFVRILSQYVLKHLYPDSVTIDNSNAWDLVGAGGTDLSDEVDSLLAAIYDRANDTSFVRILVKEFLVHRDSVLNAITDPNKANFKAAPCAGSGARTVVIWIKDITDSTGIAGFEIDIEDSVGGGGVYGNTTNPSGCCTLSLDDATWTIHLQKVPYSITSPVYETISGNTTLTYYATPFTPGSPPADSLCVVYGYVKKSNGTPYVGAKVEMWMDVYPVTFGGILIDVVTKQVVYTNTAGRFEFSDGVYYSSSLNPSNLKWKVRIKTTNWLWEGRVIVPSQASWEIEIPDL